MCGSAAAGYFCEACGAHFRPETMRAPQARVGADDLEWREVENLFLRIPDPDDLERKIRACGAPEPFIEIIRRFLAREQGRVRLTAPGKWGVPWDPDQWGTPRILFEAGWEYALTCGDRYAAATGTACHPMESDGGVTTLVSFGIDNAILLLAASVAVMSALHTRKPFDYALTNHFYNLQGAKFSTSRAHVIWAGDIVEKTPASSDAVRCFLARESPEHGTTNFDVCEFIDFVNAELAGRLQDRIDMAYATLRREEDRPLAIQERTLQRLKSLTRRFDEAFRLDAVSVRSACEVLLAWIAMPDADLSRADQAYGWLKGLSYFAAPLMPELAETVWHRLGHQGLPRFDELPVPSRPQAQDGHPRRRFRPLSLDELRPCLPESIPLAGIVSHA